MEPSAKTSASEAWSRLVEVDWLRLHVIVDNETDGLSSASACCDPAAQPSSQTRYTAEFTWLTRAFLEGRAEELDFSRSLYAGHGLSILVTAGIGPAPGGGAGGTSGMGGTDREEEQHMLLFDGGPRPDLWSTNVAKLALDLRPLEAAVLSHWHTDHSGGLAAVARLASEAKATPAAPATSSAAAAAAAAATAVAASAFATSSTNAALAHPQPLVAALSTCGPEPLPGAAPDLVFDLHPDRPQRRGFATSPGGPVVPFTRDVLLEELQLPHCRVELHNEPHTLLNNFFYVSGPIPRITDYEVGLPNHQTQLADNRWVSDPLLMDERYLAVRVRGLGAVVLSACSHAGIVNVAHDVTSLCAGCPPAALVGGLHLAGTEPQTRITRTVADLAALQPPPLVLAGHCTGWRGKAALEAALPGRFQPCVVGGRYDFLAPGLA